MSVAEMVSNRIAADGLAVTAIENVKVTDLVAEYGTPLWVISSNQIRDNFSELAEAAQTLQPFEIAYSIKANNNRSVLETMRACGALVDCSSEWELKIALAAGVPGSAIILNGNGKSESYLQAAVDAGVRQINVDSLKEVQRLEDLAQQADREVDCVVRVKLSYRELLAVDPSYERTLRVAEAKFGSSIVNGDADRTIDAIAQSERLNFRGLSHHAGFAGYRANYTPDNQLLHVRECAREMAAYATVLRGRGTEVERLDVGGGLRSGRNVLLSTPGDGADVALHPLPTAEDYIKAIAAGITAGWAGDNRPLVQFETGGFQVANAVSLITTVQDVKETEHPTPRRFITVDSAMTMFTSRGSSRVGYPVAVAGDRADDRYESVPVEVVGPTCAYDSIAEDILLPRVEPGDLLMLMNQGAYAEVTSTQFNAFPRPAVVIVDGKHSHLVRRRETLEDIVSREVSAS
ncbi:hypothetical protein MUN77_03590 [Leucobacter allii]|uniref:diaminopimelate decarboxylase family protein n=1 Tax=Leucobacter allii TaxID=2932247 RepID=UPI001FD07658|nr:hypothetical protein [Leucobacter allii]UOR02407.1 hypothetical protein MUN77_03590 [Leucobacter allii]